MPAEFKKMIAVAIAVMSLFATHSIRADWDWDNNPENPTYVCQDVDGALYLDIDGDIDHTFVEVSKVGNEIEFYIEEYQGGILVNTDEFDRRIDDQMTVYIRGSEKADEIIIKNELRGHVYIYVDALGGNDEVDGGDNVRGGEGDDLLLKGVSMSGQQGDDWIYAGPFTEVMSGQDGEDYLDGDSASIGLRINGGPDNDYLVGSPYADYMVGGDGDDIMFSRGGGDTMYGDRSDQDSDSQPGDDFMIGGEGEDIMRGGDGDDLIYGAGQQDFIYGEGGLDFLIGGGGVDIINPGAWEGTESTFGSSGADYFVAPRLPGYYRTDYDYQEGDDWVWSPRTRRR